MGINRGKQFEDRLQEQFEKLKNTNLTRLYDVTMGYSGVNNPCDFIIYKYPNIFYMEAKAIHGNCLNFKSHIKDNQWDKLLEYSQTNGVRAGIICWFIDKDITLYLPIQYLAYLDDKGEKSFNINKSYRDDMLNGILVFGEKKRVFYEYNLKKLLEDISNYESNHKIGPGYIWRKDRK